MEAVGLSELVGVFTCECVVPVPRSTIEFRSQLGHMPVVIGSSSSNHFPCRKMCAAQRGRLQTKIETETCKNRRIIGQCMESYGLFEECPQIPRQWPQLFPGVHRIPG